MSFVLFGLKLTPGKWEPQHKLLKEFIQACGEFVGMAAFVFCGIGGANSALRLNNPGNLDPNGENPVTLILNDTAVQLIAWCFGMGLCINIYAFYRYTGGVFNPAVAFSLFAIGAMSWTKFLMYVIAEMLGATVGAAFIRLLYPADVNGNRILGVNGVAPGVGVWQAVGIEAFGTFLLCFVVLMMAAERNHSRPLAPLVIGLTVYACHLLLIPYTGCSVNPARSFGAALAAVNFTYQWVFWVGPLIGSLVAVAVYGFAKAWDYAALNGAQDEDETVERILSGQEKIAHGATVAQAADFAEGECRLWRGRTQDGQRVQPHLRSPGEPRRPRRG
ncbi:aquaporin-like protein [Hyaloraphidium curvatum]|nr:aquaporin-like protein [Hyaloraphidium curvatum]